MLYTRCIEELRDLLWSDNYILSLNDILRKGAVAEPPDVKVLERRMFGMIWLCFRSNWAIRNDHVSLPREVEGKPKKQIKESQHYNEQ